MIVRHGASAMPTKEELLLLLVHVSVFGVERIASLGLDERSLMEASAARRLRLSFKTSLTVEAVRRIRPPGVESSHRSVRGSGSESNPATSKLGSIQTTMSLPSLTMVYSKHERPLVPTTF
jgi:hypothetical protein